MERRQHDLIDAIVLIASALRVRTLATLLGMLAIAAGCTSVRSDRITVDRMDYGQVIAESWKRQTLLNVVRMRYGDAPVFLDVTSVINSYSIAGKASAAATIPSVVDPNVFSVGAEGAWSNTPTVTYQPLIGDRFTRSLLHPVPPTTVFQMLQAGWAADLVIPTVVNSINGLRNDSAGTGGDPAFSEVVAALARIQRSGGLAIRMEARKDGSAVIFVLRRGATDAAQQEDRRRLRELLGFDDGVTEFEVTYGLLPRDGREVAMLSRSMLEIMLNLGNGIDLPAAHVAAGRALPGQPNTGPARALIHIRSGSAMPADTYAAVQYRDYWYWIDDADIASKRAFTFLMILFSLAETGQPAAAPVVTVPSR